MLPMQATMASPASDPSQNHDPSPNSYPSCGSKSKIVYQIGGVPVEFPYKPYGSQLAFMGRVISTLERARRQGHCHALLESPTGTGKSLSLLCSSLAWQQHQRLRALESPADPPPTAALEPLVHGGGFVPEPEPPGNSEQPTTVTSSKAQRKQLVPIIYYASRTHSQISQVIREYRKTSYRVPMAVLAARKHYCTNKSVCTRENVDEDCKLLLKDKFVGCPEFKNAQKVKSHHSLQKGGCHEVHDIEDLVKIGHSVKGCSYFAAQSLASEAHLVFCPYSYIVSPIVRRAMDLDIKGSIVILDEAHNIEDMSRDAGSLDVEEDVLHTLQAELGQLCMVDSSIYGPLYDMIQGIISWMGDRKNNLQQREFEHYASYWTGDKAIAELQHAGITQQCFPILQECATKVIKASSDAESDSFHLSGISMIALDGIFTSFGYFFSGNGCHTLDYQLALQRYVKRDGSKGGSSWTFSMNLWCLNPAVVFREIAKLSLSVILTSGTLSPMSSFASELGVQFEACMEAPHVIDAKSQLWVATISSGPGNCQLNASYKTADGYVFQDALGTSLEEICKLVPGGALVFFPSYKLLEKLCVRWCQTGQWQRLNAQKPVFVEPRGNTEDFESVLRGYYDSVSRSHKSAVVNIKAGMKRVAKSSSTNKSEEKQAKTGAAFLAVCRGKVSEGIDFSDDNARVVIIVGIPFPNINDMQVKLKKRYNDTYKLSKGLLSGSEWYCHQAFRALNQAAGRCIRHRYDYGAIIFLDERFKEERNLAHLSKWLRNSIKQYDSFEESLEGLQTFFQDVEEILGHKGKDELQKEFLISDSRKDLCSSRKKQKQAIAQKKNQKQKKPGFEGGNKLISPGIRVTENTNPAAKISMQVIDADAPLSRLKNQHKAKADEEDETNECVYDRCSDYIELDSCLPKHSRRMDLASTVSFKSNLDVSNHVENSKTGSIISSLIDCCGHGSMHPAIRAIDQACHQLPGKPSFLPLSTTVSNGPLSDSACTPERTEAVDVCQVDQESSLNLSVNSHCQKRRKHVDSHLSSCTRLTNLNSPDAGSICQTNFNRKSRDTKERAESHVGDNCTRSLFNNAVRKIFDTNCGTVAVTSTVSMEERLQICCLSCKRPLGKQENSFLVSCSLTTSSKAYVAHVMKDGPQRAFPAEYYAKAYNVNLSVVISDVSSVSELVCRKCVKEDAPNEGFWSKQDGCVYKTLFCPFCTIPTCLGLQILATDASNVHFLNKIIFYADRLDIKKEENTIKEASLPADKIASDRSPILVEIEKYAYKPQSRNPGCLNTPKSKLRLPKRD